MKLINAEVENKRLLEFIVQNYEAILYALEHQDREALEDTLSEYFDSQKVAYDVDKVMKQMEENAYFTESTFDEDGFCNDDSEKIIDLHTASLIVGGYYR